MADLKSLKPYTFLVYCKQAPSVYLVHNQGDSGRREKIIPAHHNLLLELNMHWDMEITESGPVRINCLAVRNSRPDSGFVKAGSFIVDALFHLIWSQLL